MLILSCAKNKSRIGSRSRDMVAYIFYAFDSFLSLTLWHPAGQLSLSKRLAQPQTFRHVLIETTANMGEHTASKNVFSAITKWIYWPSSHVLDVKIASHIQTHAHVAVNTFVSRANIHSYTHIYVSKDCYIVTFSFSTHWHTHISNKNTLTFT